MSGNPDHRLSRAIATCLRQQRVAALLALVPNITRACRLRGDTPACCAALIAECQALPADQQADMSEHFKVEGDRWAQVAGQPHAHRNSIRPLT